MNLELFVHNNSVDRLNDILVLLFLNLPQNNYKLLSEYPETVLLIYLLSLFNILFNK